MPQLARRPVPRGRPGQGEAGLQGQGAAGRPSHRIKLSGQWWASRQTSRSGDEKIASQQVEIKQEGDLLQVATITRGLSEEEGCYHWNGALRLWDNEILMGWYAGPRIPSHPARPSGRNRRDGQARAPYEVPGISTRTITDGNPDYLAWIAAETAPDQSPPVL